MARFINTKLNKVLFMAILVNMLFCFYYLVHVYKPVENLFNSDNSDFVVVRNERQKLFKPHRRHTKDPLKIPGDPIDYSKRKVFDVIQLYPEYAELFEPEYCPTCDFIKVADFVYIYSAYLDVRNGGYIRIVGIVVSANHGYVECLFPGDSMPVLASFYRSIEDHGLPYAAHIISCAVPVHIQPEVLTQNGVVLKGSFGEISEETTINVTVAPTVKNKCDFVVCVPPLYGNIPLIKIVEFIEVTKMFGAEHFIFYDYDMDENIAKLLNLYEQVRTVTVKSWKHKFNETHVWYNGQSATVWDCLLENMAYSKYIALNDIDEFIVPRSTDNWLDMIINLIRQTTDSVAAFRFQSATFDNSRLPEQPTHSPEVRRLVTLDSVVRDKMLNPMRSKVIVDPQKVFEVGIHTLFRAFNREDKVMMVEEKDAVLHHYRVFGLPDVKAKYLIDDRHMWNYYDNITEVMDRHSKWLWANNITLDG